MISRISFPNNRFVVLFCNVQLFFYSNSAPGEKKMLRRKPTRLELKIDDTAEFESVKKELEVESFNEYQTISTEHFSVTHHCVDLNHSGWRRFSHNRCHFSHLLIDIKCLGVLLFLFSILGQEASAGGVRIWRWRQRGLRHQCWHDWGWSLCIHVDLHSGVTRWTHKWANWLQASSWTSDATDAVWKFAVFIGCAFL